MLWYYIIIIIKITIMKFYVLLALLATSSAIRLHADPAPAAAPAAPEAAPAAEGESKSPGDPAADPEKAAKDKADAPKSPDTHMGTA